MEGKLERRISKCQPIPMCVLVNKAGWTFVKHSSITSIKDILATVTGKASHKIATLLRNATGFCGEHVAAPRTFQGVHSSRSLSIGALVCKLWEIE
jgi:hypothetical protein